MPDYDAQPIRPGAAPTLTLSALGNASNGASQPISQRMTEVLIKWLRFHFSLASRIEYPVLADRVWTNLESTPLVISSLAEWKPNEADKRPAILIDRLDQETDMQHRPIGPQYQGVKEGYHEDFMVGQHVVHCLGGKEGEAEYLAFEVWRELKRFAPVVRDYLCLYRFIAMRVPKRRKLDDEHSSTHAISIPVIYNYGESWKLFPTDESVVTQIQTILDGA